LRLRKREVDRIRRWAHRLKNIQISIAAAIMRSIAGWAIAFVLRPLALA
jgi:hypothetical protein